MGFAFTVIFVMVTIISPEQLVGEWAAYRPMVWFALVTAVCSVPNALQKHPLARSVQTYLLLAFIVVIAISQIANGWNGGALESWQIFLPSAAVFFFIVANTTTLRKMKILTFVFVVSCLVVVAESLSGYYFGFRGDLFILHQNLYLHDQITGEILRLRAAGFLNDPNDFAQILIIALPLMFVAWERGRAARNLFLVLIPATTLIWAIVLTHSRGALVGLAVIALSVVRRKLGTIGSAIVTGSLVLGLLALNFSGGRQINAAEGADRLEAWATGLELFKGAPLFGIGFNNFTNFSEITAHNSFILCLAELGFVGSMIWVTMLVSTLLGLNRIIAGQDSASGQGAGASSLDEAEANHLNSRAPVGNVSDTAATVFGVETEKLALSPGDSDSLLSPGWALNIRLALIGFLTTGWFLSRSYKTTLYLVIGLATALIAIGPEETDPNQKWRWVRVSFVVEIAAIVLIYILVRFWH